MKRFVVILLILFQTIPQAWAVLKEKDLDETLSVLRRELTEYYEELDKQSDLRRQQNQAVLHHLMETLRQADQNALMLYSQKSDYIFDLTYACHQATEQYQAFRTTALPFRTLMADTEGEIAKYDSLVASLETMPTMHLSRQARIDRSVCLTLAVSILGTLTDSHRQTAEYIEYYDKIDGRLKSLNDYANKRYNELQTSIFGGGSSNYFTILGRLGENWEKAKIAVKKKYTTGQSPQSQWNTWWIVGLFAAIAGYVLLAVVLNIIFFRFLLPQRFHGRDFIEKRTCIIMTTTTLTFALLMEVMAATTSQNFIIMASRLLVEYAWLLGAILISLLLRVSGSQVGSAFRIYAPLIFIGLVVIVFRIVLIPGELVGLCFPPILLVCSLWQWSVISRHNRNIPRSDIFYSYITLAVFVVSVVSSWAGHTLLAVQILIWWIMQLTCTLTITCLSGYIHQWGQRHGADSRPVSEAWLYRLILGVVLPVAAVLSVMVSIYWAAEVFNLSDLCWQVFNRKFINQPNLQVSIVRLCTVVCLWFLFSYVVRTLLDLMQQHFEQQDPTTAQSRMVMARNVMQLLVWGVWLLVSLSLLHISVAWLIAISGGLSTGIGFASKDIIENIYYGASLMTGRVKVGDWIEVDGTMGRVTSISYTSTVVESLYGEVITFQNAQLFAKNYKNLTRNHGYVLAAVPFGVAYGSDLKEVERVVTEAVSSMHHQWADPEKPVKVVVTTMNDSSIDFKLFVWADAVKKVYVVSDVLRQIYDTLNAHHIEIPFPQQDVHIR